jgi:hypothetical protein
MKNLTYVGGSKGGTGKSLMCMALIDYFRKVFPGEEILLIETDSSNPDVGRLYSNTPGVVIDGLVLGEEEKGWTAMIDAIDDTRAKHILINSMAASNLGIQAQGSLFEQSIMDSGLPINFNVFWTCNRNKDSVTLLRDFLACIKSAMVYPVLNLYFGKEEEFLFYRSSRDVQEMIAERGGKQLIFPNLNDLIADKLYTDEICFEALPSRLKLGMRTSLERWRNTVKQTFDEIYAPLASEETA